MANRNLPTPTDMRKLVKTCTIGSRNTMVIRSSSELLRHNFIFNFQGAPTNLHSVASHVYDVTAGPSLNYYEDFPDIPLMSVNDKCTNENPPRCWRGNTFWLQFPQFLFKLYHTNEFYQKANHDYLRGEFAYWAKLNDDPNQEMWTVSEFEIYFCRSKFRDVLQTML